MISYSLTFLRIPLAILYLYIALNYGTSNPTLLVSIVLGIILSDYFDGYIADRYGFEGAKRRLMDSIVDRTVINSVFAGTVLFCNLPVIFYLPFLIREILLVAGGLAAVKNYQTVIYANILPKFVNISVAIAGVVFLLNGLTILSVSLFFFSYIMILIGMIDYVGIYKNAIHNAQSHTALKIYYPERLEGIKRLISKPIIVNQNFNIKTS